MNKEGELEESGIPASLVAKFLDERGIVVEKTGPYNLLFLFSIGIDKSKAMQLLRGLTEFKRGYDLNLTIKSFLPSLYNEDPSFYEGMRVQELAQAIHDLTKIQPTRANVQSVRCTSRNESNTTRSMARRASR